MDELPNPMDYINEGYKYAEEILHDIPPPMEYVNEGMDYLRQGVSTAR